MIKKDTIVVLISTAVGTGIITILSFFIVWIGFPAETPQNSFKDALGFAGGLFGGLATFGAAIVAAHLFNDWKEQHNKEIEIQFILKVIDSFELFDLKITKMFQFDYPTIDIALRHDIFIRECSILELDVRLIQVRYGDYLSCLGKEIPQSHKEIFLVLRRSISQLKRTDDIIKKRDLIKHRISHDLLEFTRKYDETIYPTLLKNLKALT